MTRIKSMEGTLSEEDLWGLKKEVALISNGSYVSVLNEVEEPEMVRVKKALIHLGEERLKYERPNFFLNMVHSVTMNVLPICALFSRIRSHSISK